MIFGWLQHGRTDRWLLVDLHTPWPALHNARATLRAWADHHDKRRLVERSEGPRRCPWPCKTSVKEDGHAELRIWPCGIYGVPRRWCPADNVWRPAITELAEAMATDIGCNVEVMWMMGGGEIERALTVPGLRARRGFQCWGKGEHEPKKPPYSGALRVRIGGNNLRILPQGEDRWR
jgi:hypothetical protein